MSSSFTQATLSSTSPVKRTRSSVLSRVSCDTIVAAMKAKESNIDGYPGMSSRKRRAVTCTLKGVMEWW